MNYSMNLMNLKMATTVAAVLTLVASLAPESAHATPWRTESKSTGRPGAGLEFTLNTSDMDSSSDPKTGEYKTGIENLNESFSKYDPAIRTLASVKASVIPSVTLYASRIDPSQFQTDSFNNLTITTPKTGLNLKLNDFTQLPTQSCNNNPCINTEGYTKGVVVYEATFNVDDPGIESSNKLVFFLPSLGNPSLDYQQLVKSLSGLDGVNYLQGELIPTLVTGETEPIAFGTTGQPYLSLGPVEAVPEPADTASVLAFGAMGAISLLRRKRGYIIHLSNRNATLSSQGGRPPL